MIINVEIIILSSQFIKPAKYEEITLMRDISSLKQLVSSKIAPSNFREKIKKADTRKFGVHFLKSRNNLALND